MKDWYLMTSNTRPNLTGGFENDTYLNYKDDALTEVLETDIATTVTLYNSDLSKSVIVKCIIQNTISDTQKNSVERQGLFQINTLKDITYVFFDNKYWLIVNCIGNNGLYEKAVIQLCNYMIKFQSPSGTILSYYCVDKSSSTIGLDENKSITTVDGVHYLSCPFDNNTKIINVDKRFFIDKYGTTTCKVTHVNNTEFDYGDRGLIIFTAKEDAYNPNTDINGICDYFSPITPPNQSWILFYSNLTCSNPTLTLGSKSGRTVTAKFFDDENTVNTTIVPNWTYEYPVGFSASDFIITPTVGTNKVVIKVLYNEKLLGKVLKVTVGDGSGGYVSTIELKIIAGV